VVHLTNHMVLTWAWTNIYQLTVTSSSDSNGSVNASVVNGWYTNGTVVTGIFATVSNGYAFSQWTGPVESGHETDNPLSVTMTNAKSLTASFISTTGGQKTWNGVGAWESSTNWTPAGMPGSFDDVTIQSGTNVFGYNRQAKSLIVSNGATLLFTNWTAKLAASNVTVQSGGTITCRRHSWTRRFPTVSRSFARTSRWRPIRRLRRMARGSPARPTTLEAGTAGQGNHGGELLRGGAGHGGPGEWRRGAGRYGLRCDECPAAGR